MIHAFWIPAFRLQEDVVPGHHDALARDADRLGSYPVVCNLLCGLGHSLMRSTVHVVARGAVQGLDRRAELGAGLGESPAEEPASRRGYGIMWRRRR